MDKTSLRNDDIKKTYAVVMDAIVTQELKPSQKVSENIFSDMFDISRSASKTLIEFLVAKQFLVSLSPRVTQVAPLTLLDIRQNFHLRKLLMPDVLALSAAKVDFYALEKLNEEMLSMMPIKNDESSLKLLNMNKQFNLLLANESGYPLMFDWITQLEDTAMRYYWLYIKTQKSFPLFPDQQTTLLKIMKSDEPKKIKAMTHEMLNQIEERILNAIFSHDQFYTQDLVV